jgi:hypothetical protein
MYISRNIKSGQRVTFSQGVKIVQWGPPQRSKKIKADMPLVVRWREGGRESTLGRVAEPRMEDLQGAIGTGTFRPSFSLRWLLHVMY